MSDRSHDGKSNDAPEDGRAGDGEAADGGARDGRAGESNAQSNAREHNATGGSKPARRANGTFQKGHTANRNGRPKTDDKIPHPEVFRDSGFAIASFKIPTMLNGKKVKLGLLEANLLALGLAGAKNNVSAAELFVRFQIQLIEQELRFMREEQKNLERVEPSYMKEMNPILRKKLKEAFEHAMNVSRGRRETSMPTFPPRKRRR